MKSDLMITVLDETVIDVKEDVQTTIDRLRELQGSGRQTDSAGRNLTFLCNKKGRFIVRHISSNRRSLQPDSIDYVTGEVCNDNGQTKVKIYTVHDRSGHVMSIIAAALLFIMLALYLVLIFTNNIPAGKEAIFVIGFIIAMIVLTLYYDINSRSNRATDIEIIKKEAVNRVNAVDLWDK